MASTYISRTTGTPTDNQKCTVSFWWKNSEGHPLSSGSDRVIFGTETTAASYIYLRKTAEFALWQASTGTFDYRTTRLVLDSTAWYHICCTFDTTLAASEDRLKIYINGVRETAFNASSAAAQDSAVRWNEASKVIYIGGGFNQNMSGLLSHFHFIDGLAYDASTFGETDSTSGIWKIKTSPSVTYGNNGFFLKFEDRTNLDLDSSPNAHTFTTTGNLTPTYDCPSNNFCLPNALNGYWSGIDNSNFSDGNTTVNFDHGNEGFLDSTMGVAASKWYWEVEMDATSGTLASIQAYAGAGGVQPSSTSGTPGPLQNQEDGYAYFMSSGAIGNNSSETAGWGDTFSTGDVLGIALDLDNNKIYFARNGTWMNSGDPTSGATGTGAAYTLSATPTNGVYMPAFGKGSSASYTWTMKTNFGNGYLGTDTVGTTNQDSASVGYFKYAVPTGYYALCTKNIKAYGGV